MILLLILLTVPSYILWTLICLEINHRRASRMGIPLIRIPVDFFNVPFQVFEPFLWSTLSFFNIPLPYCARYMKRGWHFTEKARSHLELGPVFAFVTPKEVSVQLCDPEAIHEVWGRRADFPRPARNYELLSVYGPSISTASPENWARHRKVLASPFGNEAVMRSVWDESVRQTQQMMHAWTISGIGSISADMRAVSLNVLAATGFRRAFDFKASGKTGVGSETTLGKEEETTGRFSYRDALQIVLDNAILILLIPRKHLQYSFLPAWMRRIGKAAEDFYVHMQELLREEVAAANRGEKGSGSLITAFERALDEHDRDKTKGLSADEILGNLFVINFAGHDTTANTLAFAALLLAAHPEVQDWIAEEINAALQGLGEGEGSYGELFPKLVRCRAVMLETLRLFPPIMSLPKITTVSQAQTLRVGDREITLLPDTFILSSVLGTHTHPDYWSDPLTWQPTRWIESKFNPPEVLPRYLQTGDSPFEERIRAPVRKAYFPWSDGPQNCPGLKFSEVEFVAVLAYLFREHRIETVSEAGETGEQARERTKKVVNDCEATMLLKMRDADRVNVKFVTARK
ncbi:cytochrome P450 [Dendryphion nanum]|uniref:Cytochrome P450 n=1 Tax=Dendryphion nanum TaxID=256645 RepID=A0A9P9IRR1_9PLEO|nr:cytochrome P450 [Dendryphion nanum]